MVVATKPKGVHVAVKCISIGCDSLPYLGAYVCSRMEALLQNEASWTSVAAMQAALLRTAPPLPPTWPPRSRAPFARLGSLLLLHQVVRSPVSLT